MGGETRHGQRVYYEKVRKDGRVTSRYWGSGLLAEIQADRTEEAHDRRGMIAALKAEHRVDDALLHELTAAVEACATAALLAAGCHTHHRTWRKRR